MSKPKIAIWMYQDLGGDRINAQLVHRLQQSGIEIISAVDLPNCMIHHGDIWTPCGENLSKMDLLFQMNADGQTPYQNKLLRILEMQGVTVINSFQAFNQAKDKLLTNTILKRAGIATPAAIGLSSGALSAEIAALVKNWQGILLKPRGLHGGKGIVRWLDFYQLKDGWDLIKDKAHQYYLEEFIEFGAHDYRVEIIDGQFAGGYSRQKAHAFKTNISAQGGLMGIDPPSQCKIMARQAVAKMQLHCSIVDIVRSTIDQKYYLLEVNPALGVFNEAAIHTGTPIFFQGNRSYQNDELKISLLCNLLIDQVKHKNKHHESTTEYLSRNSLLSAKGQKLQF